MTCNIKEQKKDYYLHEKDDLASFKVDQTVIIQEEYLDKIVGLHEPVEPEAGDEPISDWYPFVNSYYPFTEDVDALERANHLLEAQPSCISLTSLDIRNETELLKPYSEKSAQNSYLLSNPVSFIILGKPGIGEQELGKKLSDFWQCICIEPDILIQQEIKSDSRAGQCIEFNLRCGRAIGIDVILRLVEKRVNSESAKHRGFVICGLPLIPNDLYHEDPISSESAVFTVKEIFDEVIDTTIEIGVQPPSRPPVSLSSKFERQKEIEGEGEEDENETVQPEEMSGEGGSVNIPISVKTATVIPSDLGGEFDVCLTPEIGQNYEDQLNFLFNLLKPPLLIIYILCNNLDVVNKRKHYKFDIYSGLNIDLLHDKYNKHFYEYFSTRQAYANFEIPEEFLETVSIHDEDNSNLKHLVSLPQNFPANISTQLDSYHYTALRFIEHRIVMHDPQYFLKVDGRTSIQRMFQLIKAKLKSLPLQKVVLPKLLSVIKDENVGEGAPFVPSGKVLTLEENFKILRKRQAPSNTFKWNLSDWGTQCPVSMRKGFCRKGDPDYAVQFMNKLFFLVDENAFFAFYRNPRPFLLPPYPKSSCKVFIFGPKCSGKTAVANCLSYFLNGVVLNIDDMLQDYLAQKEDQHKEKIRQAAIPEALNILNEMRKKEAIANEERRIEQIKEWVISVRDLILELINLLDEMDKEQTVTKFEISSFPMAMKKVDVAEIETETTVAIRKIRDQLDVFKIPVINDKHALESLIHDKIKLLSYLPDNLKKKCQPKPATVFDEFVINYANEAVANADLDHIEINNKNVVEMFINTIKIVEDNYVEQGNNRGGWILDGMFCDVSIIQELYPDYIGEEVIVLKDTSKNKEFLKNRFSRRGDNMFRDYRQFFLEIGKIDAAWRSPSIVSTKSYKTKIVRNLLSGIIDDDSKFLEESSVPSKLEIYEKELLKFDEKWEEAKQFFQKLGIEPIEMEVTGKTLPELLKDVIKTIENRYRVNASLFNEEDRAEEVLNFGNETVREEEGEGPSFINEAGGDLIQRNRRYGDTYHYCPVTYHDNWVLWKGKEDFAVKFQDAVYLLCSEPDMKKFLDSPRSYLTDQPPTEVPPARICVVGVPGSGKTTICKNLSNNFGLSYISYSDILKQHFKISSAESLDVLKNNKNMDPSLYGYLNFNTPLPESFYKNVLSKLWFDYPLKRLGFVIDHFPKKSSDVQYMIKYKLIPDIIIELTSSHSELKTALINKYMSNWQAQMELKHQLLEEQHKEFIAEWEEKRQKRFMELLEERREKRYAEKRKERKSSKQDQTGIVEDVEREMNAISQVSFDSIAEQKDLDEVNRILDVELPELQLDQSESFEEAKQKYETSLTETFTLELEALEQIKVSCDVEMIPFIQVIFDSNFPTRTFRNVLYVTRDIKNRTLSIFERCYEVSMEVADRLLSCGYFFLGRFGKTCPVQYFENKNPFQMFIPMDSKNNVYPVIHRSYIYFVIGRNSLEKFKDDPLKYVNINFFKFPLVAHKVAIIGPPKCGKSTLARRINKEYGMKVVSRGQAARFVLSCLQFSSLAQTMEQVLRQGWELTDEMIAKCIEAVSLDSLAVTQGIIFDGFPNSITEVKHLSYLGLVPNLVIDLEASQNEIFECLSNDTGKQGYPRFSENFVEYLFSKWTETAEDFRKWFDREYQVTTKVPIGTSNWSVWSQASGFIKAVLFEIKYYHSNAHAHKDCPLRVANMQVTPLEFLERQSSYKTFCPCCLHFSRVLSSGGEPPDRTGLVQWRNFFYWLCGDHIESFLKTPEIFLSPYNNYSLPEQLPKPLILQTAPKNVFEGGVCVVCYKKKRVIVKGNLDLAIDYNNHTYLFSDKTCLNEFMKEPHLFPLEINFKAVDNYPSMSYGELPILGMLEQYVARPIIKAVQFITRRRPVIPGLGIAESAAVGIGIYLNVHNDKLSEEIKPNYKECDRLYHERREKLIKFLDNMKSIINPYLHYEEPMPAFRFLESLASESTESVGTAMSKLVEEMVDTVVAD
ncbi:adenylate kinase 9-like [Leptinotarsa decemlineata]|uniref:adenylate kinase 9-like n=1 Tax=Leptinotarsa decemlineata TaxID=7539 RepID=UPI003D3065B7